MCGVWQLSPKTATKMMRLSNCMYHSQNENFHKTSKHHPWQWPPIISIQRTTNNKPSWIEYEYAYRLMDSMTIRSSYYGWMNGIEKMHLQMHGICILITRSLSLHWSVSQSLKLNWNILGAKKTICIGAHTVKCVCVCILAVVVWDQKVAKKSNETSKWVIWNREYRLKRR